MTAAVKLLHDTAVKLLHDGGRQATAFRGPPAATVQPTQLLHEGGM